MSGNNGTLVQKSDDDENGLVIPKEETNSSLEPTDNKRVVAIATGALSSTRMSRSNMEPPSFISDKKSYVEYKADLNMWSRITSLDKKIQTVVYRLEGHPSRIKKILTQLGDKLVDNENVITGQ